MRAYGSGSAYTERTSIRIARDNIARIRNARGVLLCVQSGAVWITQSGSTADICLDSGESFRIERNALTLVSPFGPGHLALVTLEPAAAVTPSLAKRMVSRFWGFCARLHRMPPRLSVGWI